MLPFAPTLESLRIPNRTLAEWETETEGWVSVGPAMRTVLQVRPVRDVQICSVRVQVSALPGLRADIAVVDQDPATGLRARRVKLYAGRQRVTVRQDFPGSLAGRVLRTEDLVYPEDYWQWGGWSYRLDRSTAVGVVVWTNKPALCQVKMAGR